MRLGTARLKPRPFKESFSKHAIEELMFCRLGKANLQDDTREINAVANNPGSGASRARPRFWFPRRQKRERPWIPTFDSATCRLRSTAQSAPNWCRRSSTKRTRTDCE